ncbi:MAG: hypothetical protein IIA40_03715 [SAR324 cluster bacterium]|nr:hypothetical protein [SAR324 cluster bacterium]
MRFTRRDVIADRLRVWLSVFDESLTRLSSWAVIAALLVLLASGAWMQWIEYQLNLVSLPVLRSVHALAGLVLLLAVMGKIGGNVLRALLYIAKRRGVHPEAFSLMIQGLRSGRGWAGLIFWILVGALLLSGIVCYVQLRHGATLLPLLAPATWCVMHGPLTPYLYAILLINLLIRGIVELRRALAYLYAP